MGTNKTPDFLRGFILPIDLGMDNIWQSESNFTQQGVSAGDPQPQQSTKMRVLSKGSQSTTGDITIVTRKAGSAGNTSRFTFKDNKTSTTVEYGRDAYNAISGFQYKLFTTIVSNSYFVQDTIVTSSNTILACYFHDSTNDTVEVLKIIQDGTETTSTIYTYPSFATRTQRIVSSLCELEDGSILLCHLLEDNGKANIRIYRSEDDGQNWDVVSRYGFDVPFSVGNTSGAGTNTFKIERIRMRSISGTVLLFVETESNNTSLTKRNQLFQYVSIDNGGSFQLLTTTANAQANSFRKIDLKVRLGRYVVSYVATKSSIHYMELPNAFSNIHLLRSGDSYTTLVAADVANGTDDYMTDGDLALLITQDGSIYIYFHSDGSNDFISTRFSTDGETFRFANGNLNSATASLLNCDDSFTRLSSFTAVHWLGRGVIVSNMKSSTTSDNSLMFTYLGGYSSLNLPQTGYSSDEADWTRTGYIRNYLPLDEPSNITGLTVSGTGTDSITSGSLRITSSSLGVGSRNYTWNNLPSPILSSLYTSLGIFIRCSLTVDSGGDATTSQRGFTLETDDGTNRYAVGVYITPTQIVVEDTVSSSVLATISNDNTRGVDIIFSIATNRVSGWKRVLGYGETKSWTNIIDAGTVTSASSTSAGHRIKWGHLTYANPYTTDWHEFHVSTLTATGRQLAYGFDNPEDLTSMPYPPLGQFSYVFDNVSISSTDGSTYEGEQFRILPQFDYPIGNIFPDISPTPRIKWRSQSVAAGSSIPTQTISFKLDSDTATTNVEHLPNDLMGFHFSGVNWKIGELFYHNGSSWVTLGNIQNYIRCSCVVNGRTIRGNTTQTQAYFTLNELAGWTAHFLVGASFQAYKIISNSEGVFGGTGTTTKQCTIIFDEQIPSSVTSVWLVPNSFSIVRNMNGIKATGFKLQITTDVTYDNDFRIGELLIGYVLVPGRQYGRGRTISIESGTQTIETQDGIRYSRELKPPQRVFSLAWTDGIDISQLQGDEPNVDYWISSTTANAEPIAVNNEAPDLMIGFLKYLQGSKKHLVYLPNITKSTSTAEDKRYLGRQTEQVLVTLESDIQIEHVVGDELQSQSGEVFRIATINLREII